MTVPKLQVYILVQYKDCTESKSFYSGTVQNDRTETKSFYFSTKLGLKFTIKSHPIYEKFSKVNL